MEEAPSKPCQQGHKRIQYINSLFRGGDGSPRLHLLKSLVWPMFDYCAPFRHSRLKGPIDEPEKCIGRFVESVRLGSLETKGDSKNLYGTVLWCQT